MYIFLVLVVYNLWRDCNKCFIAFFFEGRILEFYTQLSKPSSVQFSFMNCNVLIISSVQLKWTKMYFIVNYWSSQFVNKVLSKRILKNSICNLCWVFSEASWTTAASILDVEAFHTTNMADRAAIWAPAKTTDN